MASRGLNRESTRTISKTRLSDMAENAIMDNSITIELPWPPSANQYTRHVQITISRACPYCKRCGTSVRALLSRDGRQYLKDVDRILRGLGHRPMHGPLAVHITLCPPDRRSIDTDNRQKPLLDALKRRPKDEDQTAWIFATDDSQVIDLHTVKAGVVPGGKCIVTITPIGEPQQTLGFFTEEEG